MPEIICTEAGAWPGIAAALAQAQPGDTVRLQPGRYAGSETLVIPSGISLAGEPGAILVFEANGPALRFQDAAGSSLASVELVAASPADPPGAAADDPVPGGPGLICIERSRGITIAGVAITALPGAKDYRNAITLLASEDCAIAGCTIASAGRNGILLVSSHASIQDNEIHGMRHGIDLCRSALTPAQPSKARIEHNRCHDNTQFGIILLSSEAEAITQNECWGNQAGIALGRDDKSPDQPSKARIEHNCCHDNTGLGIILFSSEAEAIAQNECWGNQGSGIGLGRDDKSPDQPSKARIEHNRCHDNTEAGIVLSSSEAEAIAQNECWGNQGSGIGLGRDDKSPDQPSKARIEHNRCHDNTEAGIVLSSSEAEAITQNECWGNQVGIALQRDDKSPDQPSKARIEHNRCHDNTHSGIVLFSSEAEAIAQNECWGNQASGIALGRDDKSPDQPSKARIEHNRCHDNTEAGIVLFSSEAEAIAQNECWGNQLHGIALQRDGRSPDQPSKARIEHNRCHDNTHSGIVLFSSEAEAIAQNECWGNQASGIALERDDRSPTEPATAALTGNLCDHNGRGLALLGATITALERNRIWDNRNPSLVPHLNTADPAPWTPPASAIATAPDPEAAERRRRLSRSGALEALLLQAGCAAPAALARFASGLGCPKCLAAAWPHRPAHPHKPSQNPPPQPLHPGQPIPGLPAQKAILARAPNAGPPGQVPPQTGRLYRLTQLTEPDGAVFTPRGRTHLTDLVWAFARPVADGKGDPVKIIGVLGGNGADVLGALAKDAILLREARHGHEDRLLAQSPKCAAAYTAFATKKGRQIGALLDIDCAARAALEMAGTTPPAPLFQRETLGSEGEVPTAGELWRGRLPLLLRPLPLLKLAVIPAGFLILCWVLGQLKGYPGKYTDAGPPAWYYVHAVIAGSNPWDWGALAGFIALVPVLIVWWLNRDFPNILRVKLWNWILVLARRVPGFERILTEEPSDEKPALRWVARRLFGDASQGFALLALRDPDLWTKPDLDRLRALLKRRPPAQGLAIIVPISFPAQIVSGLLLPWIDPETRRPPPDLAAAIELLVLPETPAPPPATQPAKDPPLTLLGIEDAGAAARGRIYRDLRDDRLTPNDIVPLLVFGSAPGSPFVIAYDEQNTDPSLDEVMAPYVQFVADAPGAKPAPFPPSETEARILHSPCTLLHVERQGKRTRRNLLGRGAYHDDLAALLRRIFDGMGADFTAYRSVLAGCGQFYNLREASWKLGSESLPKIARHLRAAAALAQAASPAGPPHRAEMLHAAWTELAGRLPNAPADPANPTLAIELIGLTFGAAAPAGAAQDRLSALIAPAPESATPTLQTVCAGEIARVLSALCELDPVYAGRVLDRLFAGAWRPLAAARPSLSARLAALRAAIPPLSERLAGAADYEAFAALLQAHQGDLPRFMTLCTCIAARGAGSIEQQQRLVQAILAHAAAGLQIDPDIAIGAPSGAGKLIDHLADPSTSAIIMQAAIKAAGSEDDPGDEIYLDSFDRATTEIQNLVEVVLQSRGVIPPAPTPSPPPSPPDHPPSGAARTPVCA